MENNRENRFSYKLIWFQFMLSVLVVLIHAVNNAPILLVDNAEVVVFFGNMFSYVGNIAVPCFFSVSGFLFYQQFKWDKLLGKFKRRVLTLIIPFVIWNSLIYFAYLGLSQIRGLHLEEMQFSVKNYMMAVVNSEYSPLWYIRTLFVYVLLTPIFVVMQERKWTALLSIGFLLGLGYLGVSIPVVGNYYLPFYLIGAYMAKYHNDTILLRCKGSARLLAAMGIFVIAVIAALYIPFGLGANWLYTLRLLGVLSAWFALDWFRFENKPGKWMRVSFAIYAMHCVFIKIGKTLAYYYLPHTWWVLLGEFVLLPGITVAIIVGINCALSKNRYTQKIWWFMLGNR